MVWAAVAIGGAAVVGAGASIYAGNKAAGTAAAAADQQTVANANQLAFQKQQYTDWQNIYGPIQQNLSGFYKTLSPDSLVASGLKNYQQQHLAVQTNIDRAFATNNIDSAQSQFLKTQSDLAGAEYKANLRNDAPLKAAQLKQGFIDRNVQNPASVGVSNAYGNQAAFYGNQANQANSQAALGYQAAGQALQGGVQAYSQFQQYKSLQKPAAVVDPLALTPTSTQF